MGEKDLAEKSLLGHADVFVDSMNALLYGGEDRYLYVIHSLTERDRQEGSSMCELLDRYWNGGVAEGIVCSVRGMWQHDFKAEQIAMFINQKLSYIRDIIHLLGQYPEEDDAFIAKRLLESTGK